MNKYIKYIIIAIVVIILIVLLVLLNINRQKEEEQVSNSKTILTSFYPIYIIAENITEGAQNIELVNMADVNVGCLHDYTLTTEDMKKIENADIFIMNGLGMENFIEKALETNNNMNIIDSSSEIENVIQDDEETNAHIWTNLENYIIQVKNISNGLINQDSENAEIYQANTDKYINELDSLKEEYEKSLEKLNGTKAISLNEAFEYLGQELGIDMTTIHTDHEESTMSAEMLSSIIDQVKNENINMIIVDKDDNKSNAETIANETGAKIYELNSGLRGSTDKNAYIEQVKENMQTLAQ